MPAEIPLTNLISPTSDITEGNVVLEKEGENTELLESGSSDPENFARYLDFPHGYPHMIIELGVARGGTTAMSKVLASSPSFDAFGEDLLRNAIAYPQALGEEPSLIEMPGEDDYVFLKETYGPSTESMISHYPLKVWRVAAERAGISNEEFNEKTHVLGVTRDPLAIYNGWLKYWVITKGLSSLEEAQEQYGPLSRENLTAAYHCFFETISDAGEEGLDTSVVVAKVFERRPHGIEGTFKVLCDRLGIEFTPDMILFQDPKKEKKRDLYPVSVDSKYKGLHKQIDDQGFRYIPPKYQYFDEVLPSLQDAGLIEQYQVLHSLAEQIFGEIDLPSYLVNTI